MRSPPWYLDRMNWSTLWDWSSWEDIIWDRSHRFNVEIFICIHKFYFIVTFLAILTCGTLLRFLLSMPLTIYIELNATSSVTFWFSLIVLSHHFSYTLQFSGFISKKKNTISERFGIQKSFLIIFSWVGTYVQILLFN